MSYATGNRIEFDWFRFRRTVIRQLDSLGYGATEQLFRETGISRASWFRFRTGKTLSLEAALNIAYFLALSLEDYAVLGHARNRDYIDV